MGGEGVLEQQKHLLGLTLKRQTKIAADDISIF